MKFGIFYEHQLPRPWKEGDELKLYQDALDQVELADKCLLYTSPSPRDVEESRMPSSA